MNLRILASVVALSVVGLSCGDPVHDEEVEALGPDPTGQPNGPTHRAGEPCLVCHGGQGPAHAQFSLAGTIYGTKGMTDAVEGAVVHLEDATNKIVTVTSNSVGNFYIPLSDYAPTYPLNNICIHGPSADSQTMFTHVMKQGSCAGCHFGTPGPTTPGPVFITDPTLMITETCQ
jgi:hypothetical protein